jgi:hypothetical protein
MSLLETLRNLQEELKKSKEYLEKAIVWTNEANQHWQDVCRATLDDWSEQSTYYPQERISQNDEVHGGSFMDGIEVISECRDPKRARGWKKAFRMTFQKISQLQRTPPDE